MAGGQDSFWKIVAKPAKANPDKTKKKLNSAILWFACNSKYLYALSKSLDLNSSGVLPSFRIVVSLKIIASSKRK